MDTMDQKSIFGVLVGLAAIFLLWLWASGKAAVVWAAVSGSAAPATPAGSVQTGASASATNGSTGAALAAAGGTTGSVAVPNYASTLQAVQSYVPNTGAIGGYTYGGATSGGVSVTPTALANTFSQPGFLTSSNSGNWLSELLTGSTNTQVATNADPTNIGSNGTLDPVTGLAQGGV